MPGEDPRGEAATPKHIADLVRAVGAAWTPPRPVTADEYQRIACNRCGACCEDIPLPHSPAELEQIVADPGLDPDRRAFAQGLIPVVATPVAWRYRCRHFTRDHQGLGVCAIYETRPAVCRHFPVGNVVRRWAQCAWYVEIQDETGASESQIPERSASAV